MTRRTRWDRLHSQYHLIRDCLSGEDAVKDQGQLYIPKPDGISTAEYSNYVQRGVFYGAPEMTLRALVGLALRKEPVIKLPARLEDMRLAATHENAPLSILIEECVREVLAMGKFGMLLDFPPEGNVSTTTPHISTFKAEEIEEMDTTYVNGRKVLSRVVLSSDEDFDGAEVRYELVLEDTIYKFRRFVFDQHKNREYIGDEIIPTANGQAMNEIPFVVVSPEGLRFDDVTPPFLALCKVAVSHLINSCDRERAIFLTACPTPYICGNVPADKVPDSIGSGALWNLPEGTEVGMLEFQGAGVASQKALMDEKIDTMAQLGARMLSVSQVRNETFETATQRTRSELSLLHGAVVNTEYAIERLLRLAASWVRADADDVSVDMSKDFIEVMLDAKQIEAQLKLWQSGAMSFQTLYENLQRGEVARADRPFDIERDMIEEEGGLAIGLDGSTNPGDIT